MNNTLWAILGVVVVLIIIVAVWTGMSRNGAGAGLNATSTATSTDTGGAQAGAGATGQGAPQAAGGVTITSDGARYLVSLDQGSLTVSSGVFAIRGSASTPGQLEVYLVPVTYLGSKDKSVVQAYLQGHELFPTNGATTTSANGGGINGAWTASFGTYTDAVTGLTQTHAVDKGTYNVLVYLAGSKGPLLASGTLIVQ